MKKIIKKYGNSHVIILSPEDLAIHDIKEGDVVDISDIIFTGKSLCRGDKNDNDGTALMPLVNKSESLRIKGGENPHHNNQEIGGSK